MGTPLYNPYMYVLSQWVWFLCCFGLKTGIHCRLCPFGLELDLAHKGTMRMYDRTCHFNSKLKRKKE